MALSGSFPLFLRCLSSPPPPYPPPHALHSVTNGKGTDKSSGRIWRENRTALWEWRYGFIMPVVSRSESLMCTHSPCRTHPMQLSSEIYGQCEGEGSPASVHKNHLPFFPSFPDSELKFFARAASLSGSDFRSMYSERKNNDQGWRVGLSRSLRDKIKRFQRNLCAIMSYLCDPEQGLLRSSGFSCIQGDINAFQAHLMRCFGKQIQWCVWKCHMKCSRKRSLSRLTEQLTIPLLTLRNRRQCAEDHAKFVNDVD